MSHAAAKALREEVANSISHGFGAALGVAGLVTLVVLASLGGDPYRIVAMSIYGASLVVLFGMSAAYHGVTHVRGKSVLQVLDHCAIYILIAGTYTPFALVPLRGPWGWSLLGAVWGMAALGITYKWLWFGRYKALSVASYLVMGWLGVVAAGPLLSTLSPAALGWLVAGGVAYSGGVGFFVQEHKPWHHLLWHVAVLLGAACHFMAVLTLI